MKSISNQTLACIVVYDELIEISAGRSFYNSYLNAAFEHVFQDACVFKDCSICRRMENLNSNLLAFCQHPGELPISWLNKLASKGIDSINIKHLSNPFFRYSADENYTLCFSVFEESLLDLQFLQPVECNINLFDKKILFEQCLCFIESAWGHNFLLNDDVKIDVLRDNVYSKSNFGNNYSFFLDIFRENLESIQNNVLFLISAPELSIKQRLEFKQHLESFDFHNIASYNGISFFVGDDILVIGEHGNSQDFFDYLSLDFISVVNKDSLFLTYYLIRDFFENTTIKVKERRKLFYYFEDRYDENSFLPVAIFRDPFLILLRLSITSIGYTSDYRGETFWLKPYPIDDKFLNNFLIMNFILRFQPLYFFDMALPLRQNRELAVTAYDSFFNFINDEGLIGSWHGTSVMKYDFFSDVVD